jgi:phosphoribosylformylglycinamidine synthase
VEPYTGSVHAVYEAMRNLVAVGSRPLALTDCLNFGNPEDPEVFHEFTRSVRGLGDAARALGPKGLAGPPIPYVSGNVSFYNESSTGRSIEPSPIVAALGVLDDYAVAITWGLKRAGSAIVLTGPRGDRTGASQLRHALTGETGGELPGIDLDRERMRLYAVLDEVRRGSALACHDIARGGLAFAAFEMALSGWLAQGLGAEIRLDGLSASAPEVRAYGESPGFLLEVPPDRVDEVVGRLLATGLDAMAIGRTLPEPGFRMTDGARTLVDAPMDEIARIHLDAIRRYVE